MLRMMMGFEIKLYLIILLLCLFLKIQSLTIIIPIFKYEKENNKPAIPPEFMKIQFKCLI